MKLNRGEPRGEPKLHVHVLFPPEIVHQIDDVAGTGNRSAYIIQAVREQLARDEMLAIGQRITGKPSKREAAS